MPGGVLVGGSFTGLDTQTRSRGIYAADTWSASPSVNVTASARSNHTQIRLRDRLGTALNGAHVFDRFVRLSF